MSLNEFDSFVVANLQDSCRRVLQTSYFSFLLPRKFRKIILDGDASALSICKAFHEQITWLSLLFFPKLREFSTSILFKLYLERKDDKLLQGEDALANFISIKNAHPYNRPIVARVLKLLQPTHLLSGQNSLTNRDALVVDRLDQREASGRYQFDREQLGNALEIMCEHHLLDCNVSDDMKDVSEAQKNFEFILTHLRPSAAASAFAMLASADGLWRNHADNYRNALKHRLPEGVAFSIIECQKIGIYSEGIWVAIKQCEEPKYIGWLIKILGKDVVTSTVIQNNFYKIVALQKLFDLRVWDENIETVSSRTFTIENIDMMFNFVKNHEIHELAHYIREKILSSSEVLMQNNTYVI